MVTNQSCGFVQFQRQSLCEFAMVKELEAIPLKEPTTRKNTRENVTTFSFLCDCNSCRIYGHLQAQCNHRTRQLLISQLYSGGNYHFRHVQRWVSTMKSPKSPIHFNVNREPFCLKNILELPAAWDPL